jgi:hypothetical protein
VRVVCPLQGEDADERRGGRGCGHFVVLAVGVGAAA